MDYEASDGGVLLPVQSMLIGGYYHGQIVRDGVVIDEWEDHNLVVDQGLNHILNTEFMGSAAISAWYLGLFEGNYTPVAGLTAAGLVAAATESIAYNEATRQLFVGVTSTAKSMTNTAARATFTFNAAKTLYGAFLISDSTKSGTAGVLFSAARFATAKVVAATDQLLLAYTFNQASS